MPYAFIITIAAGLALLMLLLGALVVGRRGVTVRGWSWYPSPLALLLLLPLAGLLLWRFLPIFLLIPIIVPFIFRRGRRLRPPFIGNGADGHNGPIDAEYRPADGPEARP